MIDTLLIAKCIICYRIKNLLLTFNSDILYVQIWTDCQIMETKDVIMRYMISLAAPFQIFPQSDDVVRYFMQTKSKGYVSLYQDICTGICATDNNKTNEQSLRQEQ